MQELFGTYRGFTPTDESDVGMGELEIVIDDHALTMSIATGLGIETSTTPMSEVRTLTAEEISIEMEEGAILPVGTQGILLTKSAIRLIFVSIDNESGGVVILGMMSDEFFGPSFVFTPFQIKAGMFEKALAMMEERHGKIGVVPLLSCEGKSPNNTHAR